MDDKVSCGDDACVACRLAVCSVLVQTYAAVKVLTAELQVAAANKFLRRMRMLASGCERAVSI